MSCNLRKRCSKRRGMAVILILGMLAMTLALSYATLRGQATTAQLTSNLGRGDDARLAAESGMQIALRRMTESNWAGTETTFTGSATSTSAYSVSYVTGDERLTTSDPQYGEYPYRVTITSTGTATDPTRPNIQSIYKIEAVVQLARRTLNPAPSGWSNLQAPAVYQWANQPAFAQVPMRIEGPATFNGAIRLCAEAPTDSTHQERYLEDLNLMRLLGQGDQRPFSGPLAVVVARQSEETMSALTSDLGLVVSESGITATSAPVTCPTCVASYRLYPGGKLYMPPVLQSRYGGTLMNLTIGPDPRTNPLGVLRSTGELTICNNVNITGTIIAESSSSDLKICGQQVTIAAPNLPAVEGSSQAWQLPAFIVRDDLRILESSVGIIGQAVVFDDFEVEASSQNTQFLLNGQLLTASFAVRGRTEWSLPSNIWTARYNAFVAQQYSLLPGSVKFFPVWMQSTSNLMVQPNLKIQRGNSGVKFHWPDWGQPLFQKDSADTGLRWNVVRWTENL
ncbi:MAG: hypothetical protein SFU86_18670 [Pirellulaceae bacterium]|nr:hypothetical protein [Pirellulaceae bacterium]